MFGKGHSRVDHRLFVAKRNVAEVRILLQGLADAGDVAVTEDAEAAGEQRLVHAIALDKKQLLPVSSLQTGAYGLKDVCLSVPTVVGVGGAEQHLEIKLWPKEEQALKASAKALQDMLAKVAG